MAGVQIACAQSSASRRFDIPAGSLSRALAAFGRQAGLQVAYRPAIAAGLRSPGASGELSPGAALGRLLSGTGLSYRFSGAGAVTIERLGGGDEAAADGATALEPIDVGAAAPESARGPVDGYVARGSATATKTDTPIIETPQSISVITREQIEDQQPQSMSQALRYTSGVVSEALGIQNHDAIYIRGFSDADGGGIQYLDGLKLPYGVGFANVRLDPYLLERIDVLKGPASVLYGQSSPGGIVNMTSKTPIDRSFGEIQLQGGSYKGLLGAFDIGGRLDHDGQFIYRLTGAMRDSDSQVDFVHNRRAAIAPSFTWRPDADTKLTVYGSYQSDDPGGRFYNIVPASGSLFLNQNGKLPRSFFDGDPTFNTFDRTQYYIGYAFEHRFDDVWTVRQNMRFFEIAGTYKDVFGIGYAAGSDRIINRYTRYNLESLGALTNDNQIEATFTTGVIAHHALLGLDYQHVADTNRVGVGSAPSLDAYAPVYYQSIPVPTFYQDQTQILNQTGLYVQDQMSWAGLHVMAGLRRDWADLDTTNHLSDNKVTHKWDRALTWRAGALYEFLNGVSPYFSYSTSFFPTTGVDFGGKPFDPTTGEQYEAGVKYKPPGYNAYVTVSAFDIEKNNVLTPDPDPTHLFANVQTGQIRSRGIEVTGVMSLTEGLNAIVSYTHNNVEVTKATDKTLGKTPLYAPRDAASGWLDYTFGADALSGLTLGGGVRYVGWTYGDTSNTFKAPGYAVADAMVRYRLDRLHPDLKNMELQVNASNLFDRTYVGGCSSIGVCYYGMGRTVLATLKYRW
ncbi:MULTISPECIES: TonB-dependent siderophore receptor [Methylosinus]|nr:MULTISPECIES: TonB-dependent siderophore receptor [Methylosinus]